MMNLEYGIGDMVLVPRGQKTRFFEVKGVTDTKVIIENGWVRIDKNFDEVVLICKKENRNDLKKIDID
jgi:hypothetical protein